MTRQSSDGQATQVDMLDGHQGTRIASATIALYPNYFNDGSVAEHGRMVVLGSAGNETCAGSSSGTQRCTVSRGGVAILDAVTGRVRRVLRVPDHAWSVGIDTSANRVLVASAADHGPSTTISLFDAATGRLLHQAVFNAPNLVPMRVAVDEATGRAFVIDTPLYVFPPGGPKGGAVLVLDTHSGKPVRTIALGRMPGDVAVDQTTGRVYVTDVGPLRFMRKTTMGGGSMGMDLPVGPGSLHTLDARTGAPLATVPLGISPGAIAVDERRGHVFVTYAGSHDGYGTSNNVPIVIAAPVTGPGGLSVVDATTGRVRRTLALGVAPRFLALDDRTRQLFIGDSGDTSPRQPPDPWGMIPAQVRQRLPFLPQHAPASRPIPGRVLVLDTTRL